MGVGDAVDTEVKALDAAVGVTLEVTFGETLGNWCNSRSGRQASNIV